MMYIALAIIVACLGVIPLLVYRRFTTAIVVGLVGSVASFLIIYLSTPSLAWPFWGAIGFLVFIHWLASAIVIVAMDDEVLGFAFPAAFALIFMSSCFARESGIVNADKYANLIGKVEPRVWTQDVQPKDPRHIRMSSAENAAQLSRQALGQAGSIGSQFEIDESRMTLQKVNDKFWWIVPLDFTEWATWRATKHVPAYIRVSAEDPTSSGEIVKIPEDEQFRYTPGAYWSYNLGRHLWSEGYYNSVLTEDSLEIDESGKAWWVVTVYHPTIFSDGYQVDGAVVVDPVSGTHEFHPIDQIPDWIERVIPASFVKSYIAYKGIYHLGWWNAYGFTGAGEDLTKPETPNLIYGADGGLYWATGITSNNDNDTALIGLYYTNSRTLKTVFYKAQGSTDEAILAAVDKDDKIQLRHLHGVDPQLYNIQGTMTSIVPLLNEKHLFQGVAFVDVANIQIMGTGDDQFDALRNYQKVLPLSGHQVAPDLTPDTERVQGTVDRRAEVVQGGEVIIYLHIRGMPHLFTGSPKLSVELPMTKEGDEVVIEYFASGESVEPMNLFDNLSLQLEATKAEQEVEKAAKELKSGANERKEADTARENLKNMTDEEILRLREEIRKKNSDKP